MPPAPVDLMWQTFGRLRVIARSEKLGGRAAWLCQCECGATKAVRSSSLRRGETQSCSCLKMDRIREANTKHGHTSRSQGRQSGTMGSWHSMIQRTTKERCHAYESYGGSGITVCSRYRESFVEFLKDMGVRPAGMTLDRVDGRGNYSCGKCNECLKNGWAMNCRWLSPKGQARNRKSNKLIAFRGETRCLKEWSEIVGISYSSLHYRFQNNWDVEKMLETPTRAHRSKTPGTG
jgi:hypothetical protein